MYNLKWWCSMNINKLKLNNIALRESLIFISNEIENQVTLFKCYGTSTDYITQHQFNNERVT